LATHLSPASTARADASEGELFGYKLGDRYPVSELTQGRRLSVFRPALLELVAEHPVKAKDIDEVHLVTTLKSYTIASIFSVNTFDHREDAEIFAQQYAAILRAKYPEWQRERDSLGIGVLRLKLRGKFQLAVSLLVGTQNEPDENPSVQITLKYIDELEQDFNRLAEKERNELILEHGEAEGKLEGL
jgi:hypothetical protein